MAQKHAEKADAPLAYEEAMLQVQKIIDAVEGGQVPLEQSLEQYAAGMKLIRHCRAILDRAEQKMKQVAVDDKANATEVGGGGEGA